MTARMKPENTAQKSGHPDDRCRHSRVSEKGLTAPNGEQLAEPQGQGAGEQHSGHGAAEGYHAFFIEPADQKDNDETDSPVMPRRPMGFQPLSRPGKSIFQMATEKQRTASCSSR